MIIFYIPTKSPVGFDLPYQYITEALACVSKRGENSRKFMTKTLKKILLKHSNLPMDQQKEILDNNITEWIGAKHKQVDDILIFGIKYNYSL